MNIQNKAVFGLVILFSIIILIIMLRSKHFFRSLFLSSASGISLLFAVNLLSDFTGFEIGINPATLLISSVNGTAGVILLLFTRAFLL